MVWSTENHMSVAHHLSYRLMVRYAYWGTDSLSAVGSSQCQGIGNTGWHGLGATDGQVRLTLPYQTLAGLSHKVDAPNTSCDLQFQ